MTETQPQLLFSGRKRIFLTLLLPMLLLLVMVQMLIAQELTGPQGGAPLLNSSKVANVSEARPGETVHYTIVISNSGDANALNTVMTDTLPAEFSIISNTLTMTIKTNAIGGDPTVVNDIVTWDGIVGSTTGLIQIEFDAVLTDTAVVGDMITNTAQITGTGTLLAPEATIEVSAQPTTFTTYLPIIFKPFPAPTLTSVSVPTSIDGFANFDMTATWEDAGFAGISYILQESKSSDFSNPTDYDAGSATSFDVTQQASADSRFYYRLRIEKGGISGPWSNVIFQSGAYLDDFTSASSGWAMRREDTDDTNNSTQYTGGRFKMKIGGRWDSMIASPLMPMSGSWSNYRIETRVLLGDGIDNLHSYGLVFGADWDGITPCPNGNFYSCFNRYYRLNVVWDGSSTLKAHLKRIDWHNTSNNTDSGETLMEFRSVNFTNPNSWTDWTIDVYASGTIRLYAGGQWFYTATDTNYVGGGKYFGTFASADEYLGTAAFFEYYKVTPLP